MDQSGLAAAVRCCPQCRLWLSPLLGGYWEVPLGFSLGTVGNLRALVSTCQVLVGYESLQVLLGTCGICFNFRVTSLHLAAAATATSLYCFHLSNIVGKVKEVDRVKEVSL